MCLKLQRLVNQKVVQMPCFSTSLMAASVPGLSQVQNPETQNVASPPGSLLLSESTAAVP